MRPSFLLLLVVFAGVLAGGARAGPPLAGENLPGQPLPGEKPPGQPLPGQPLPGQSLPGQPLPGQSLPGQPLVGEKPPGQPLVPGQPLPGQPLPGQSLPGQPLPGQSLPGQPLVGEKPPGQPLGGDKLSPDYYAQTCPRAERIVAEVVQSKQMANPTTAAGVLRLFFHDCFVSGCDASVLVAATAFEKSEQSAEINHSLPGDAFDAVVRAKLALELECPEVVSCADILALAARVLITMTGGPRYPISFGRKDSLTSSPTAPDKEMPQSNFTMDQVIKLFQDKGFTVQEMVALSGGHTLGFSHCKEFAQRIYDYQGKPGNVDPTMNPVLSKGLQTACKEYLKDPTIAAFNDVMTPGKFDNMYFVNLERGLGLLATDEEMWSDKRTQPFVKLYASNPTAFFDDFSRAIDKLSLFGVKTGAAGEIRRRCDTYNHGPMPK
ncbi:peroxidase 31-like [Oryza glaberrima]|uniref:peroxidase 31-like n=1 Tax=Oryza glaberrima TaxID=4538 RepID=UPI00224C2E77|nr:peroxidase 31-like [Oryza glaberrima]